jgi:hypothetical protein
MGIAAPLGVSAAGLPPTGDQSNAYVSGTFAAVSPGKPFCFRGPMNVAIWASLNDTLTTTNGSSTATVATGTGLAVGQAINSANVPRGTTWKTFSGTSGTLAFPTVTLPATGMGLSSGGVFLPPGSNVNSLVGATVTVPSNAEGVTIPTGTTVVTVLLADVAPANGNPGTPGLIRLSANPTAVPSLNTPVPLQFALTNTAVTTGVDTAATFTGIGITFAATLQLERSFDGGSTWILCNIGAGGSPAVYNAGTPVSFAFGEPEKGVLYRLNCTAFTSGTINYRMSETGGAAESLAIGPLTNG